MKQVTFLFLFISNLGLAQSSYWQQYVRYSIDAELNTAEKSIQGKETILYRNNSPDTLNFIWFHIWPNAYHNDSTALMKQIHNDKQRKEKENQISYGFIDGLAFQINNRPAQTEPHSNPEYIDIIKVVLPQPLNPGDSVTISTPFHVKLPSYFSRSGFAETEFMICQWYPKPAVFDHSGWHEFPYLDMGEFYSEYGDYQVRLTVPSSYVVGATGTLLTPEEIQEYKRVGSKNAKGRTKPTLYTPTTKGATKTLSYQASMVPDFAWFTDKDFVIQYDTVKISDRVVDAFSYYHNKKKTEWVNSIDYVKDAVRKYSGWIGDYAYPVVQAVEGPANSSSGGMEYPMITLITNPDATPQSLDGVITHEVGHNWFMSMLGSNERDHAWMDEGLNTYFEFRYEAEKYRYNSLFEGQIPAELRKLPADLFLKKIYTVIGQNVPMESAMDTPSAQFSDSMEYSLASYIKTALWMYLLETSVGREKSDLAVKNYFSKWKNKHPTPGDMETSFEEALGFKLDEFFALTKKTGRLE